MLVALFLMATWLSGEVRAEHALSEVWSEADGLQMKYSTDHDDMLSTKGSELSLQTHGQPKQDGEKEAAGQQDEASSSNESGSSEPASSQSTDGSSESASSSSSNSDESPDSSSELTSSSGSEQGADSTRQSNRVTSAKHNPMASDAPPKQVRFSEPAERYRSSSDEDSSQPRPSAAHKSASDSDGFNFNTASDQSDDSSETANADHGDDSDASAPLRESPHSKFRPPGRLFKEAIRMNDKTEAENSADSDNEGASRGAEATGAAEDTPTASGEPEFPMSSSEKPTTGSFRARQNMIDFDRLAGGKQRDGGEDAKPEDGPAHRVSGNPKSNDYAPSRGEFTESADENENENESDGEQDKEKDQFYRPNGFHDHSNQRAMTAGSTAHKERLAPTSNKPSADTKQTSHKLPAYFRSASPQLQQQQHQQQQVARFGTSIRNVDSSDDVRDNFISPGHYPGSMPHLTQAASETQKKQLELSQTTKLQPEPKVDMAARASTITAPASLAPATESSQQEKPAQQQQVVASDTVDQLSSATVSAPEKLTAANRVEPELMKPLAVEVTPVPESQPESQQIMAPILLSTTTMAPMAATSAPSATSEAPSLKRFKFRKYR